MKILFINSVYNWGSTGIITHSIAKCAREEGNDVLVAYGRGRNIKDGIGKKFGYDFETFLHAFLTRVTGLMGYFSFFSTLRLKQIIKKFKPDVINIHETHSYFLNVCSLFKFIKKMHIPVVFTNHCMFLYTGKCGYSGDCNRYKNGCGHCPHIKDYPKSLLFDLTKIMFRDKFNCFKSWDNISFVSPSHWIDNKMDISFLKNKDRHIINNGVDINKLVISNNSIRRNLSIQQEQTMILMVAPHALSERKGGMFIIDLAKKCICLNYVFVIVGCDDVNINHTSNVRLIGPIYNRDKLSNFYNSADIFMVPSSMENYPTTSIEAQCFGLPVIGFDIGGVKETILEGNGCVVPFGDYDAANEAICKYKNDRNNKKARSIKAREYFSEYRMTKEYLNLYANLIRGCKEKGDSNEKDFNDSWN